MSMNSIGGTYLRFPNQDACIAWCEQTNPGLPDDAAWYPEPDDESDTGEWLAWLEFEPAPMDGATP